MAPLKAASGRRALLRVAGTTGLGLSLAALGACTAAPPAATRTVSGSAQIPTRPSGATLLIFFSRAGENYWNGGRRTLTVGNTALLAATIAERLGCDSHEIKAADPYPDSYDATVARNLAEGVQGARPGIAGRLPDPAGYGTLILASPIWNVAPPMIMSTLLDSIDTSGKLILPVTTYAMSGLGRALATYRQLAPRATVGEGLAVRGEEAGTAGDQVEAWLRANGLKR